MQDWFRITPHHSNNVFIALGHLFTAMSDTHYPSFLLGFFSLVLITCLKLWPRTRKFPATFITGTLFIIIMAIWNASINSHGACCRGGPQPVTELFLGAVAVQRCCVCSVSVAACVFSGCLSVITAADVDGGGVTLTEAGVAIMGDMKLGLPKPISPTLDGGKIVLTAVLIMFVGAVESIAVVKTFGAIDGCVDQAGYRDSTRADRCVCGRRRVCAAITSTRRGKW